MDLVQHLEQMLGEVHGSGKVQETGRGRVLDVEAVGDDSFAELDARPLRSGKIDVRSLSAGEGAWLNIQPAVRGAFLSLLSVLNSERSARQALEEKVEELSRRVTSAPEAEDVLSVREAAIAAEKAATAAGSAARDLSERVTAIERDGGGMVTRKWVEDSLRRKADVSTVEGIAARADVGASAAAEVLPSVRSNLESLRARLSEVEASLGECRSVSGQAVEQSAQARDEVGHLSHIFGESSQRSLNAFKRIGTEVESLTERMQSMESRRLVEEDELRSWMQDKVDKSDVARALHEKASRSELNDVKCDVEERCATAEAAARAAEERSSASECKAAEASDAAAAAAEAASLDARAATAAISARVASLERKIGSFPSASELAAKLGSAARVDDLEELATKAASRADLDKAIDRAIELARTRWEAQTKAELADRATAEAEQREDMVRRAVADAVDRACKESSRSADETAREVASSVARSVAQDAFQTSMLRHTAHTHTEPTRSSSGPSLPAVVSSESDEPHSSTDSTLLERRVAKLEAWIADAVGVRASLDRGAREREVADALGSEPGGSATLSLRGLRARVEALETSASRAALGIEKLADAVSAAATDAAQAKATAEVTADAVAQTRARERGHHSVASFHRRSYTASPYQRHEPTQSYTQALDQALDREESSSKSNDAEEDNVFEKSYNAARYGTSSVKLQADAARAFLRPPTSISSEAPPKRDIRSVASARSRKSSTFSGPKTIHVPSSLPPPPALSSKI